MPEIEPPKRRGRGRPPGAKNKPKGLIPKEVVVTDPRKIKQIVDVGINSLHPAPKIAKELRRIAEATGFTLKRIYDDMCENGIIEIQTMYLEVINARRDIQKALDALDGKITLKRSVGVVQNPPETVRNGTVDPGDIGGARRQPAPEPDYEVEIEHQPDFADVQRGLSTPPRSHTESAAPEGVDPNFTNSFEDPLNEPEESEEEVEEENE